MADEQRITVPLRAGWLSEPIATRANRAVRELRAGIAKRTKAERVTFSAAVNHALWAHGKKRPPAKLTVLVAVADGTASARLPEEKEPPKGAAAKPAQKEAKSAGPKTEPAPKAEPPAAAPAGPART
ncbi:MAG TPA: hypothetical protein VJB16_01875 [archaeon]|nr:hypothetical protein [archaeon]